MTAKTSSTKHSTARRKALKAFLAETKPTVEDKVATLKTVHAVDKQKISAALSDMMKKN